MSAFNLSRKNFVYLLLGGFFITNAILAEITGGKLIQLGPFTMSIGVIAWPIVFLTTDIINEYFGHEGVKRVTLLTVGLIIYAFLILLIGMNIPAASFSPVSDAAFTEVFGQSLWIIVGSIVAFMVSQFIDVIVFLFFRKKTKGKMLWLRATGSTAISQLIDTFIVLGIAFWLTGKISTGEYLNLSFSNYAYKLVIAISITPLIYLLHALIDRYLERDN